MSNFQERLKTLVSQKGGQDKFVALTGLKKRTLADYIAGNTEPKLSVLQTIASSTGIDASWLCGFNGDSSILTSQCSIPHYDIQVHAGDGGVGLVPSQERYVSFDESWFKQFVQSGAVLGLLDVNGDSMSPTLRSGDSIIVNMNQEHIQLALAEGGIFIFTIRGDFKVKRLQPMANGDLRILSDNDKYEAETIPAELLGEDLHIQAVVLKRIGDP